MTIDGGCLCGAVRYRAGAEPLTARVCWCRLCQYIGAGSATVNVFFPSESVSVAGEMADYVSTADSGNVMHRRFCPKCGTHIFSEAEARSHITVIRAGTLDDPEIARPEITIWISAAPSWAALDQSIPAQETQAPPAK